MKKFFLLSFCLAFFTFIFPQPAFAKRTVPQAAGYKATTKVATKTRGVGVSVKFRGDRRGIIVDFSNLGIASSVSYSLSYQTRGTQQGVGGTINTDTSQSRDLIFGTCSAGICRYDTGITNAKFTVTTTLKNGLKILRSFRLKV